MPNINGNAYGLTLLCPIKNGSQNNQSYAEIIRDHLEKLPLDMQSPMAKVPNTYLCRFYVLNDVFYEGYPAKEEHLQSRYLVFSSNFYGDLEDYLRGMWSHAHKEVKEIWQYCVGFNPDGSAEDFVNYIKKCQVDNALFFNGSTDDPLDEQLKSLYLKQEFSRFIYDNQGTSDADLQVAFEEFVKRTDPVNLNGPTWAPGYHE